MPISLHFRGFHPDLDVRERIHSGQFDDFLLVVPTKRRLRHLTRELLRSARGLIASPFPLFTLESFATVLFNEIAPSTKIIGGPTQTILFNQSVCARGSDLEFFGRKGEQTNIPRGTFEKIVAVINHLKESGIYPGLLDEELLEADSDELQKLRDVTEIFREYESRLEKIGAEDPAGIFKQLHLGVTPDRFIRAFRTVYPRINCVVIAGFDEFTLPEIEFINRVCQVPSVSVSLIFDFLKGNPSLFGHLEKNYETFCRMGFVDSEFKISPGRYGSIVRSHEELPTLRNEAIDHFARTMFQPVASPERRDFSSVVTVVKARERKREAEAICRIIKDIAIRQPGRDLSRICVATYQAQTYTHLFRTLFPQYGIPANITDRFNLTESPVVVAILGLLEIPLRGFRRTDLLRGLNRAYFEFGGSFSAENLALVSSRLKISAGIHAWHDKIDAHIKRLTSGEMAMTGEIEANSFREELESAQQAKEDITGLENLLRPLMRDLKPREFESELLGVLNRLEIFQRVPALNMNGARELVEKDSRAITEFLNVLRETLALVEFQDGSSTPHPFRYYVEQLKVALSLERYNVREKFGQGVLVTSIEETRGLDLDIMIVAGLVDGEFPSMYAPEIFLSNRRQEEREARHKWENRYLFYQAITNWADHLYLTYPEMDGETELVRSSFVDAMKHVAVVEELTYPESDSSESVIYSEDEFLKFAAGKREDGMPGQLDVLPLLDKKLSHIHQALDVEDGRSSRHHLPEYEGNISAALDDESRSLLERFRQRPYSASQLETYGKCPFQFFGERVLQLNVAEELEEELTPLEKGSVLHQALFQFYTRRRDAKLPPLSGCTDAEFDAAVVQLSMIVEDLLNGLDIPDPFWELEKILILGSGKDSSGLLRSFLAAERERSHEVTPQFFEVGFGSGIKGDTQRDRILSSRDYLMAGDVKLRGKVDRIEVGKGIFTVVDYKTGSSTPAMDEIRTGMSLQMPLYLYAVELLFSKKLGRKLSPAAGLYYQVRDPVKIKLGVGSADHVGVAFDSRKSNQLLAADEELRNVIADSIQLINRFVKDIAGGKFPLTSPDNIDKVCSYCKFKTICRIQTTRRVASKTPEE